MLPRRLFLRLLGREVAADSAAAWGLEPALTRP
jgi:hypothetical protein